VAERLEVSKSIAVNGCCLTVVEVDHEYFSADLSGKPCARLRSASGNPEPE